MFENSLMTSIENVFFRFLYSIGTRKNCICIDGCQWQVSFNTNGIVYDNSPWRPGREMDLVDQPVSEDDERRLKSLATRIMSNGVEVLVKDKNADNKQDQRTIKYMHMTSLKPLHHHTISPTKSLLSSAVATFFNHQQMSAFFPLHQLMQHNYIIKTCMTTYTFLTTVVHNKRSVISTFETILSVVTTESLTNVFTNLRTEIKPTKTYAIEEQTIQPSTPSNMFISNLPKIEKRIDYPDNSDTFDLIQPSEPNHAPCKSSCPCPHTKTESLKTQYSVHDNYDHHMPVSKYGSKITKYGTTKLDLRPTKIESIDKSTQYGPYEYENSQLAPTDRIVEKYTEVINDYSDEKDSNSVEQSELLTNEQAPSPLKANGTSGFKLPDRKPGKPQKPNKNKVLVADLLKLGSLGIKGLSQLAPVFEKMTGGFIKRQDLNQTSTTTTSTLKPEQDLTAYHVNKRVDNEIESKQSSFPIYIPVDLDTSESQISFKNATLHQSLAWAVEHKQPKSHIILPKMVHESPLVNGGIPISPGEVITANSDVIVGKPAVGGPLTLAASGMKLHNPVNPPPIDSFVAANEQYIAKEKPALSEQALLSTSQVDDSFDLRPPDLPKPKPNRMPRPNHGSHSPFNHPPPPPNRHHPRVPPPFQTSSDYMMKTDTNSPSGNLGNHGRPAFLDYIPSLDKHKTTKPHSEFKPANKEEEDQEVPDNNASSSEIVSTRVTPDGQLDGNNPGIHSKPFLVDIQPSKVANVLIPHGSATALVFAGSSEPHKTGDYVDDPLPYPEPGYFGSFSIEAPKMTNIQNLPPKHFQQQPNAHPQFENYKQNIPLPFKDQSFKNGLKIKWKDTKRPINYSQIPPPTSNQETHVQVGPKITAYNPDIYRPNNGDFEKYNRGRPKQEHKDSKKVIDNEYENYLAVPPPPPPKMHFPQDSHYEKNIYNKRPVVHSKPIQDMNIYLNIQHPVPKPNPEPLPPKVTSEIYFAAQAPNTKSTPTYTINLPPAPPRVNHHNQNFQSHSQSAGPPNSFTVMSSPNFVNKSVFTNDINDKDNSYTVTLNTATNVASNTGDNGQVIGSSMPVPIGSSSNVDQLNTDIPVGTNFAIRVEDESPSLEGHIHQGNNNQELHSEPVVTISDNRWNLSSTEQQGQYNSKETTIIGQHYYHQNIVDTPPRQESGRPSFSSSLNSHANFPVMNDETENSYNDKPVTEIVDELKIDFKRPAKLIPNVPTNSHGWYSSVLQNENLNNIKVESTTRKMIPLIYEYKNHNVPEFGQKVSSAGKPPSQFWANTHNTHSSNNFNNVKPNGNQDGTERPFSSPPPLTSEPYNPNYIPSYFGGMKQPAYDIPVRDNSDETTTVKEDEKLVYENSEEVYDGEDDHDISENEDDVSSESMKVPVITSSSEEHSKNNTKLPAEITSSPNTFTTPAKDTEQYKHVQHTDFNKGTQTEKPFVYSNNTSSVSNEMKPIYNQMKPRPFTVNTVLDHQLQQPHWQINELMGNSSNVSYEENLELNTGEEMSSSPVKAPTTQIPQRQVEYDISKYKRPPRPVYGHENGNRDDPNIITSIVHINDKKPLIIDESEEKATLSPISLTTLELNRSSSEIIDLSPPPPTMDYNFKPSTNDEMIMGMSPPPPKTQPPLRTPSRLPSTPRPIPIRTPPPYRHKPPRTFPPRITSTPRPIRRPINREEVSTYRPSHDTINNLKRPTFNRDQPSSQLLPPPRELPSRITPINDLPPTTTDRQHPNIVFPTPTLASSGWLTSSGVDFSSSFDFAPTAVNFPEAPSPSNLPKLPLSSTEDSYSYEIISSSERISEPSTEKSSTENEPTSKEVTTESSYKNNTSSEEEDISEAIVSEASNEDTTTDKMKIVPLGNKNRTRKPYPVRNDDQKSSTHKYRVSPRPTSIIKPTRTLSRPEILYPTRASSTTRRVIRPPVPPRLPPIVPSIIESSESPIDENYAQPTDILKHNLDSSSMQLEKTNSVGQSFSIATPNIGDIKSILQTQYADNKTNLSDEVVPTKTEFRTTVVTLTKTLSEAPKTVSSIGYVNLTHTLTVTHTMTSLVSKSEGAITQTLVLTNTHTSTIVDVVTKVQTQVQPTTIVETVTKHIPVPQVEPTPVQNIAPKTKIPLDDVTISSEEEENLIIKQSETTENIQKIQTDSDGENDTFFVVMNKSQNGGKSPPITDIETGDYEITRNEQVNNNGVSQVLFGEILLAGTPYLETTNVVNAAGPGFSKECQPDCKASRNERCQRIDGLMKCVCRPGFARMFPDRPCKPTYTYSVKLALGSQGNERLEFHDNLADNSSKQYNALAVATHEGINRMVMQSDLRDVYHGVHITGFHPVEMKDEDGNSYQGVVNDFYVQLSDNAHESRLKEVIEKYLRHNNYSLGVTDVHAAGAFMEKLEVSDFDECTSAQFHDCSEHAQCFNLRGTYTCSCLEGYADLSVNNLYPGRICSAEPVGCERCNYHGSCYSRDDQRVLCECFQWYAGSACHINLKVVLISLVVLGALLTVVLTVCAIVACRRPRPPTRSIVTCIQTMPSLHQGGMPSKQRADRRALICDRADSGDASSVQNASLPYMPAKRPQSKKCVVSEPPAHDPPPPPPAPAVMIPRARLQHHQHHADSRENITRKKSIELSSSEAKLINYLESGAVTINTHDEMRRKHSMESSYSAPKDRHNKQGALVSAGFKVSTTIRPDEPMMMKGDRDDMSSINKNDLEAELHFDSLRKSYSQEDMSEWTDAERRIGELTLSEARSVGGTLPASTGRAASSTRLTHQEANTMAERDLGSTFLLPHVHLYKPDLTSDVSEFDSL